MTGTSAGPSRITGQIPATRWGAGPGRAADVDRVSLWSFEARTAGTEGQVRRHDDSDGERGLGRTR